MVLVGVVERVVGGQCCVERIALRYGQRGRKERTTTTHYYYYIIIIPSTRSVLSIHLHLLLHHASFAPLIATNDKTFHYT